MTGARTAIPVVHSVVGGQHAAAISAAVRAVAAPAVHLRRPGRLPAQACTVIHTAISAVRAAAVAVRRQLPHVPIPLAARPRVEAPSVAAVRQAAASVAVVPVVARLAVVAGNAE